MTYQPVTIPGFEQGLVQNMDPHLISDDAQPNSLNVYQWRKRLIKKGGNRLLGEGRIGKRIQDVHGGLPGNIGLATDVGPNNLPIEPGTIIYFTGVNTYTDTPTNMTTGVLTGVLGSSINYVTGAIAGWPAAGAGATVTFLRKIDQYSPVMGLRINELAAVNNEELIGFDRQFAYRFDVLSTSFLPVQYFAATTNLVYWTGTDHDFFYSSNFAGAMWVTNGLHGFYANEDQITAGVGDGGDPIRWYDGTGFYNFNPRFAVAGNYLLGARFVLPFKSRLICLNTWEGANDASPIQHRNRCRFSRLSNPFYASAPSGGSDASAWYESPGKGGFIDAPTSEAITGVSYIKDYLLVFFERSTWTLIDTGNRNAPFIWVKVNTDFGCESPFSTISFDTEVFAVGDVGIIEANSNNVARMDQKIPDVSFTFHNDNFGIERVHGIRNFMPKMAMWTYRDETTYPGYGILTYTPTFPNKILIFNYEEDSFGIFEQSYTTFANFHTYIDDTWAGSIYTWNDANQTWNSAVNQILNPTTIAGNQQGFIFLTSHVGDNAFQGNDYSLKVYGIATVGTDDIITSPQHNLSEGQFIYLVDTNGSVELNNYVYQVGATISDDTFNIKIYDFDTNTYVDPHLYEYSPGVQGYSAYTFGGDMRVIDNFEIITKKYNQFLPNARSVRLGYLDFLVEAIDPSVAIDDDTIQVETYVDNDDVSLPSNTSISDTNGNDKGTDVLVWKRTFPQCVGSFYTFKIKHPDKFMNSREETSLEPLAEIPYELHSMQMWVTPSGRIPR